MKELRTLHVDTEKGWRGGEQQALYLMRGLRARGHDVELVCRPDEPFAERAVNDGIPFHPLRPRFELDPRALAQLARVLCRGKYDILHAHTAHAHALAAGAAMLTPRRRRPALAVSRRVDFSIHKLPFGLSALKYRWGVDAYIAISACVRDALVADGIPAEKIGVVYSSVEPERYAGVNAEGLADELGIGGFFPLIVNIAMLVDHKGQKYLLDAWPRVLAEFPRAMLVIVGEGELRAALEAQAAALGIGRSVTFAGYRKDPLRCIAMADLFVMTSHMEGLCTSILDALSLSIPAVATRAGGMTEIIEHEFNGLLAKNRDPADIAAQILRMLGDEKLRWRCVEAGKRTISARFNADQLVTGTLAVYRDTLARRSL